MRISELSRKSRVPVPTIKFYLRDGLLPAGRATARNQAEYDDAHLRRLTLIRLFIEIARLDLASVRRLLAGIDDHRLSLPELYHVVHMALAVDRPESDSEAMASAESDVDKLVEAIGWRVGAQCPGRLVLASVLTALGRMGSRSDASVLEPYAEAVERLAAKDLELLADREEIADPSAAVATTVLLEVALVAMRRMALEHHLRSSK